MENIIKKEHYFLIPNKFDKYLNIIFSAILIIAIFVMLYSTKDASGLLWKKLIIKTESIELLALFTIILFVANLYRQYDNATDSLLYWTRFFKNGKLALIFTALFLGIMPVKGRTILSAPIISQISKKNNLNNDSASLVNFISTHIYYLMFPLSTSLIFVISIMEMNYFKFVAYMLPGIIFLAVMVWYYASKSKINKSFAVINGATLSQAIRFISPIIILLVFLGLSELYKKIDHTIVIGAVIFLILTLLILKPNKDQIILAFKSIDKYLIFILALILLLSALTSGSPYIKEAITGVITSAYSIPILIGIGYLVGFTTGSSSTMVSILFPLLAPIIIQSPSVYPIAAIVYSSEYAGYIASPSHPCCFYASSFFNIPYLKVWWRVSLYAAIASIFNILLALMLLK